VGTAEGRRSRSNPAAARWGLTPPVSKSNRGRGVDGGRVSVGEEKTAGWRITSAPHAH
jgi:hypothetical protein